MRKTNGKWTVKDLLLQYERIEFPEFQREATVWDLSKKRALIDSILREFDIASIYLHRRGDGVFECIDGRQRINTLISFLGLSEGIAEVGADRAYNSFVFESDDELLGGKFLSGYDGKTWSEFNDLQRAKILSYQFNVLEISDLDNENDAHELNLMFLRLQLGSPLNAGEKLNAMVGDMKNLIFKGIGKHPFFKTLKIPQRRFSKELTAAQIAINFFSQRELGSFQRARFVDLQDFFKLHLSFSKEEKKIADKLSEKLDQVYSILSLEKNLVLKNRAIGVTTFFFISNLIDEKANDKRIEQFTTFLVEFLTRLREQVEKGIDIETRYRDLLKFQAYVSQAAVEKYAFENRLTFLDEYFKHYLKTGKIKGDK